jgi:hypothetical protein
VSSSADWQIGDYVSEVYDNAPDLDSGTDIVVATETPVTGIDASLAHVNAADMMRAQPSGEEGYEILFTGTPFTDGTDQDHGSPDRIRKILFIRS